MKWVKRILLVILGIVLIGVAALAVVALVTVRRPYPTTDGSITVPGLEAQVEVLRDEWGVPHIYAQNEHDLFFAQGYVHAQDRFWQMEMSRRTGLGRLAEIVGEPGLNFDRSIRTMGWPVMAQESLDAMQEEVPEYVEALEAYSAGVNAYIAENGDRLSVSRDILGLVNESWEIEPWEPLHSVAWGVVMSYSLSGNYEEELSRADLIRQLGEAEVEALVPPYPYDSRPVIAPTDEQVNELPADDAETRAGRQTVDWDRLDTNVLAGIPDTLGFGSGPFVGSNNWVVSGEHTASGFPLLADDPHLGVQMPSIWYEAGLHAPSLDVVGFTFAGVPGVIVGYNEHIAWGVTNVGPDVQDLYIEKINPNNPRQYEYEGEWLDMEVREEVIKVNGGEDVVQEVLVTRHGPIMNEVVDGAKDVVALRWTQAEPSRILLSVMLLNRASNYEEFREALRYWDVPSQNFVYADVDGNIAYQTPGLIPIRKNGDGLVPVPGWTGEYEWEGWIPYEELPALFNPESGFIVTANHAVVDEAYPHYISRDWADGDRGQRITEMLEAAIERGDVTAEDFAQIHTDSKSLPAATWVPLLEGLSSNDPQVQAALERLRGWDLQERRDSVPATIFEIFYMHLAQNILADDIGEENVSTVTRTDVLMYDLAAQPEAKWWDDASTSAQESREDIILTSLAEAVEWLETNVGEDPDDWAWGNLHTVTFSSNPLGQSGIGPIESLVNRGPYPLDGGRDLVNANGWSWNDPAAVGSHPSMRMIADLGNRDNSLSVIPTGQSGHPYHPHYDDMVALWANGEYHPMLGSREAVEAATVDTLLLQPEP